MAALLLAFVAIIMDFMLLICSFISKKYRGLIYSDRSKIDMIDPSGGPYLHSGHDMGYFDKSFKGMIIEEFKSVPQGYLIVIKK